MSNRKSKFSRPLPAIARSIFALPTLLVFSALSASAVTLSSDTLYEGPDAGTDAIIAYASAAEAGGIVAVPPGPDWLTLVGSPGILQSGPNRIRFRFTANSGATRKGSIYINGVNLTVIQVGASYAPARPVTLLKGLATPEGIAVDSQGNLFIADAGAHSLLEWVAASQRLVTVVNPQSWAPFDLAITPTDELYMMTVDPATHNRAVLKGAANLAFVQYWASSTVEASGICLDPVSNKLYIAQVSSSTGCRVDPLGTVWVLDGADSNLGSNPLNPQGGNLAFPMGLLAGRPTALAIDDGGRIYFLDTYPWSDVKRWDPADTFGFDTKDPSKLITTLATYLQPTDSAVLDSNRNLYMSQATAQRIQELPNAYIDTTPIFVGQHASTESIQVITSHNLTGVYAPVSSNTSWLNVIAADNRQVTFSFTENTGPTRTETITILGVPVTVTQLSTVVQAEAKTVPAAMTIVAGDGQTGAMGQPFGTKLQVQVVSAYGNPLPSQTVAFQPSGAGLGLNTNLVTTNFKGIATMPVSAAVSGPISVTATVQGTTISQTFRLTGVANGIAAAAGTNQAAVVNQPFPADLKTVVYSAVGQPVPGVSVTFSVPATGPSATFAGGQTSVTVPTGADGTATAPPLTANNIPGPFTVQAFGAGLPQLGAYANFNLINYTRIHLLEGNNQGTALNTVFPTTLKVLVVDQNANPMPNVSLAFTPSAGTTGAAASFASGNSTALVRTGPDGIAIAPTLTANGTAGSFTVSVSNSLPTPSGLTSQSFTLANIVAAFDSGGEQGGVTTRTLPRPFLVRASKQATAGTVIFTVVPNSTGGAGGSFRGASSVTVKTDAQGYATSPQLKANGIPGSFKVTANDGVTTAVTTITTSNCLNPGTPSLPVIKSDEISLRNAVDNACAASTIDLTGLKGVIPLASRLRIDDDLAIVGPGASALAIDGGHATRLFFIGGGNVSISNVTLQNGQGTGISSGSGGAAAGMGGAIFMDGGSVTLSDVTFAGNAAVGGNAVGGSSRGGAGFGGPGDFNLGGHGGDLFGLGGLTQGASGGPGGGGAPYGAPGGKGGFGAGGGVGVPPFGSVATSGAGGFGGGGAAGFAPAGPTGNISVRPGAGGFGGGTGAFGTNYTNDPGGAAAGFGGAIFQRAGTLILIRNQFIGNSAVGGRPVLTGDTVQAGVTATAANNGQGKGGALFIYSGAVAVNDGSVFGTSTSPNVAAEAALPSFGSSDAPYTAGATCPGQDTADVCGVLLQPPSASLSGPVSATYGTTFTVTPASSAGATPAIAVISGPCRANGLSVTMTAGVGACQLQAIWPAAGSYSGASATLSVPAAPVLLVPSVTAADKVFDGTANAAITSCSLANVLPADAGKVTCSAGSGTFLSGGVGTDVPVTASEITLSGSAAANYALSTNRASARATIRLAGTPSSCLMTPAALTGLWSGEGNGSDVMNLHPATIGGNVTYAAGKVGQAFSFDGSQSPYVSLPSELFPSRPGFNAFTFETWFQTSGKGGGVILGAQNGQPYAPGLRTYLPAILVSNTGLLYVQGVLNRDDRPAVSSSVRVNDGQWHHVALAYDGATEVVYLDGAAIGSRELDQVFLSVPLTYQLGTGYTSGASGTGSWFTFTGRIDEPAVYSRALGATEISGIVRAGSAGKCNPASPPSSPAITGIFDGYNNPYPRTSYFPAGPLFTNVNFNMNVANATDPGNYRVLGRTDGRDPQTSSCAAPLADGDINIGVGTITYQSTAPYFAQVFFGANPANTRFKLIACKANMATPAKSIVSAANPGAGLPADFVSTTLGTLPMMTLNSITAGSANGPAISAGAALASTPASIWVNLSSAPGIATVESKNVKLLTGTITGAGCSSTGTPVPGSVTLDGNSAVFTPASPLTGGAYRFIVCSGLRGQNGSPVGATINGWYANEGADYSLEFTSPVTMTALK